jgi:hypothetical protein
VGPVFVLALTVTPTCRRAKILKALHAGDLSAKTALL